MRHMMPTAVLGWLFTGCHACKAGGSLPCTGCHASVAAVTTLMYMCPGWAATCCPSLRLAAKRQESGAGADRLRRLEADYDWIVREKANFGRGEYDFDALNPEAIYQEYQETEQRIKELKEAGLLRQVCMIRQNMSLYSYISANRAICCRGWNRQALLQEKLVHEPPAMQYLSARVVQEIRQRL